MALFKILQGQSSNLPANKVNGYCYVTTDEHKFYVDYAKENGTLDRFTLNAAYADTAGSVEKLGSSDIGNVNKPIYLEGGTPKECVDFLPLSAGKNKKLTGPLGLTENINYGIALPDNGFVGQLFFLEEEESGSYLPLSGGTMTGAINMSGQAITGLNAPSEGTQAANKNYVDGKHLYRTVNLPTSGWSNSYQTVSVSGVTSGNTILVGANPDSYDTYSDAGVRCTGQGNNTLTFFCESTPSSDVSANIVILN